ncbi:MAG: hypothetical protein D6712_06110 [Chloroflexi bacterium]|nr:MAG: hypothetical protein D6712_06110 [Chloroflexota bacterium]
MFSLEKTLYSMRPLATDEAIHQIFASDETARLQTIVEGIAAKESWVEARAESELLEIEDRVQQLAEKWPPTTKEMIWLFSQFASMSMAQFLFYVAWLEARAASTTEEPTATLYKRAEAIINDYPVDSPEATSALMFRERIAAFAKLAATEKGLLVAVRRNLERMTGDNEDKTVEEAEQTE